MGIRVKSGLEDFAFIIILYLEISICHRILFKISANPIIYKESFYRSKWGREDLVQKLNLKEICFELN